MIRKLLPSFITIFGMLGFLELEVHKARAQEHKQQIALQVVSNGTAEKLVVPKGSVILRLVPVSGPSAKAPLAQGDYMICHPYDFKDDQQIQHSGFRCGSDVYAIMAIQYGELK